MQSSLPPRHRYHTLLDRLDHLLNPDIGLISAVDFYASGKEPSPHEKGAFFFALSESDHSLSYAGQRLAVWRSNVAGLVDGSGRYEPQHYYECGSLLNRSPHPQIWFDFDHVDLSPGRRDYLEYRFGTVRCRSSISC